MELPEYGDIDGVKAALEENAALLREGRALIKRYIAMRRAIQAMCEHKMVSDGDARMPSSSCEHCGYTYGGHMQVTVYE